MGETRSNDRFWLAALLCAAALATALRLAFRIDYAEEVDSIRFILSLDRFDMAAYRPHFPGYPVFVLLGKLANAVIGDPVVALGLVCALCGGLLVLPAAALARELFGARAGWVALPVVALNPLLWLYSQKLLSDMPGLLFLFTALALFARALREKDRGDADGRWLLAAGIALGLTLGVRLSYFPFALSLGVAVLWLRRRRLGHLALGVAAGGLAWAVPLLLVSDLAATLAVGQLQTTGHFNRWGGSLLTEPDIAHRLTMLAWELLAQGLGTWWSDRSWLYLIPTAGLGLALVPPARRAASRRPVLLWALLTGPYLVWIFVGQNITIKPRHALPVVVLALLLCAGIAAARLARSRLQRGLTAAGLLLWVGGMAASGAALAREHAARPSNAVLMARDVARHCGKHPTRPVVYTSSFQRHFERHAPCAEIVKVRRSSHVKRDLDNRPRRTLAFVVSDVGRIGRLRRKPWKTYRRNRYVQNARHTVDLYRIGDVDGQ